MEESIGLAGKQTILSRGEVPILYSTTNGTSKQFAFKLQRVLEKQKFSTPVYNIGDYDYEDLQNYQGSIILLLSTYGNGDPPHDGQNFFKFISQLEGKDKLSKLNFVIMALGNATTFSMFCGHGVKVQNLLLNLGAKQLIQMQKCDASSDQKCASSLFPKWSQKVLNSLVLIHQLRQFLVSSLTNGLNVQYSKGLIDWEKEAYEMKNLGQQFKSYLESEKGEIIHIKELRKDVDDGRSTLWIRIKKPQKLKLLPACNINVYPLNIIQKSEEQEQTIVQFKSTKPTAKVPFPKISLYQLKRRVNYNLTVTNKILKDAIMLSKQTNEIKQKYQQILLQQKSESVKVSDILRELKPDLEFYSSLGINNVRIYTLSSWDQKEEYFDLCVSTLKTGLCSNYFKSIPKYIRLYMTESNFTIPDVPLIMIANGSGIAPFRSIIQYVRSLPAQKRINLTLYYGIQNSQVDYYFKEDFEKYEKQGVVKIKLAQSRKDPNKKVYVQELVEQDKELFREHFFKNKGKLFICGGKEMSKGVNGAIFKAITLEVKLPYKAFKVSSELKNQKRIVQEVFG